MVPAAPLTRFCGKGNQLVSQLSGLAPEAALQMLALALLFGGKNAFRHRLRRVVTM